MCRFVSQVSKQVILDGSRMTETSQRRWMAFIIVQNMFSAAARTCSLGGYCRAEQMAQCSTLSVCIDYKTFLSGRCLYSWQLMQNATEHDVLGHFPPVGLRRVPVQMSSSDAVDTIPHERIDRLQTESKTNLQLLTMFVNFQRAPGQSTSSMNPPVRVHCEAKKLPYTIFAITLPNLRILK